MKQISLKSIAMLLVLILCISLVAGCSNDNVQDVQNDNASDYYVDEDSGEITEGDTDDTNSDNSTPATDNETTESDDTFVPNGNTSSENDTSSNKDNEETSNESSSNETTSSGSTQTTTCSHKNTSVKNKSDATCTKSGYTGDTYCSDCNKIIKNGSSVLATGHTPEIRGKKEATTTSNGYTGDTYCKTCDTKLATGSIIPAKDNNYNKVIYTTANGYQYVFDKDVDIVEVMEYSMRVQTKYIDSPYRDIELEIFRLCNEARKEAGVAPLEWYEDAYYFTNIRAKEAYGYYSHTRPNGKRWSTVYSDADVILGGFSGENIHQVETTKLNGVEIALFNDWFKSEGHRKNILNNKYTKVAISLYINMIDDTYVVSAVQNFFG